VTWTYSGDPSTSDKDAVRFDLQDTDASTPLMTDEEIAYLLTTWMPRYDSTVGVAAEAAQRLANRYAGVVDIVADGVRASVSALAANFRQMAADLRATYSRLQSAAEIDIDNLMYGHQLDPGLKPLIFSVGMHDNPEAGQQDFGGTWPVGWPLYQEGMNNWIG
jgi:hypothetical protein